MNFGEYVRRFEKELCEEADRRGITVEKYYNELMVQYNEMLMKRNIDNIKDVIRKETEQ